MAVTDEKYFNENEAYSVAVVKEHEALKQHIAFSYPHWKLIDCDSLADATDMVLHQKADCFLMGDQSGTEYMITIRDSRVFHLQKQWKHALQ